MLYDRAHIEVEAGAGGHGCVSFRREAHVPRGGPDGGDGGRGGDVVLVCDGSLRDLYRFKTRPHRRAGRGGHGEGSLRHGADGEGLVVEVPPGTEAVGVDGDLAGRRWELLQEGQTAVVARGGPGGRGNKRFATPTRQAPHFAERGLAGERGRLDLRLRLLADVGLVGLPNAGKSSLLARLTRAAPKVADYPFTTLEPILGVLEGRDRQVVIADIPGLIEGASGGAGLGHEFLGHVERCRLLVHVLDLAPSLTAGEGADAEANYETIERELEAHDRRLAALPRVLALSKADLLPEEEVAEAVAWWQRRLGGRVPIVASSSATGQGIEELGGRLLARLDEQDGVAEEGTGEAAAGAWLGAPSSQGGPGQGEGLAEHILYKPAERAGFQAEKVGPGRFAVKGYGIERLVERFDQDNEEAMEYLEGRLRRIGVIAALEAEGFQPGDEVTIGESTFELDPGA